MNNLQSLIERLEKALGPDRELDAEIWALDNAIQSSLEFGHESYSGANREWVRAGSIGAWMDEIPTYTASLDAAVGLVPEGMGGHDLDLSRSIRGKGEWEHYTLWQARLSMESATDDPDELAGQYSGFANTAPLALCIAALKARASEES